MPCLLIGAACALAVTSTLWGLIGETPPLIAASFEVGHGTAALQNTPETNAESL